MSVADGARTRNPCLLPASIRLLGIRPQIPSAQILCVVRKR